jgi:copper transport protein
VIVVSARRRAALLLVGLLSVWLVTGVLTAGPAAAHAELVSTSPAEGARLDAPPQQVTLTFSEGVSVAAGYARVLDAGGDRVDSGAPKVDGDELTIGLRSGLPDGGYLVTYRVVSADSHPIAGANSVVLGRGEHVQPGRLLGLGLRAGCLPVEHVGPTLAQEAHHPVVELQLVLGPVEEQVAGQQSDDDVDGG